MALTTREKYLLLCAVGDPEAAAAIAAAIDEAGTVGTADLVDDAVTDAKLRESAALTVIGRSANSTGNPADIAAGSDGDVLRRSGTTLAFGTIAAAGLASGSVTSAKLEDSLLHFVDVTVTTGQILALFTTPKVLVTAPGAGFVTIVDSIYATLTYGTATYSADAAGFSVRYTNGAGANVGATLTEGFVESASSSLQSVRAAATALTPVANAAIVLFADNANPTVGDSAIKVRTYYRVVPNPLT